MSKDFSIEIPECHPRFVAINIKYFIAILEGKTVEIFEPLSETWVAKEDGFELSFDYKFRIKPEEEQL